MRAQAKQSRDCGVCFVVTRVLPNDSEENGVRNTIYAIRDGLVAQMRRSALSIPSNVAEGFRRYHNKEYKQFLYILLGSCAELETQITIAKELKYITGDKEVELLERSDHICRMTSNLIKRL